VVSTAAPNDYADVGYNLPAVVTNGTLRVDATVSFSRLLDGFFLQSTASGAVVVSRLDAFSDGTIRDDESRTVVGNYVAQQPFRIRMDVDMTAKTWSVTVDNELNGFADDPTVGNLPFENPIALIPDVQTVDQSLDIFPTIALGGSIAYDDVDVSAAISDTTPPVITVPANITVAATSQAGTTVTFAASANDAVDGSVPVTCTPTSGSTFPIGTTTVNCSASDKAGNIGHASFTITVTATDTTAPTTPTNLVATRGKTTMLLTWGASTDPDDTTLIYDIYVNDKKVGDTSSLRFQVQNLQCGMRYVFGVSARDKAGNVSGRVAKAQSTLLCG
jgi:hypothetical protein